MADKKLRVLPSAGYVDPSVLEKAEELLRMVKAGEVTSFVALGTAKPDDEMVRVGTSMTYPQLLRVMGFMDETKWIWIQMQMSLRQE